MLSGSSRLRTIYGRGKGGKSLLRPVGKREVTATVDVLSIKCTV
jgi:hypothetical protein